KTSKIGNTYDTSDTGNTGETSETSKTGNTDDIEIVYHCFQMAEDTCIGTCN
ncbi:46166_t:CDS:2, partial [Gigaspora margarita]